MRYAIFTVYDKAAGAFLPPMFMRSKGEAIRSFQDAVNASDHQFHRHAEDYVLYHLGYWQDDTSAFVSEEHAPVRVVTGLEVLSKD